MTADLSRLSQAVKAYIHELEARAAADAQRIAERDVRIDELIKRLDALEEQYRLALARQYAPKSEKRRDRVFNEAEQVAEVESAGEDDGDVPSLPDTGLPERDKPESRMRGRKPLPADLPRERIEYDLPEDLKVCPCCGKGMHRMGRKSASSCTWRSRCRCCSTRALNTHAGIANIMACARRSWSHRCRRSPCLAAMPVRR